MDTPIKIQSSLVDDLDRHKDRLGFTRHRLANNLLRVALSYLEHNGYESLIGLSEANNEMVQTPKQRS